MRRWAERKRPGQEFARPRSETHQLFIAKMIGFAKDLNLSLFNQSLYWRAAVTVA